MTAARYEESTLRRRDLRRREQVKLVTIRYGELRAGDVAREHMGGNPELGWGMVDGVFTAEQIKRGDPFPAEQRDRFVNAEPGTVVVQWRPRPFIRMDGGALSRRRTTTEPVWTFSAHNALDLLQVQFTETFWPYPRIVDVHLPYDDSDESPDYPPGELDVLDYGAEGEGVGAIGPFSGAEVSRGIAEARAWFWARVGQMFPEVTTGDFSPADTMAWETASREAVVAWLEGNHPFTEEQFDDDE